ncbi:MAG: KamA family protein [Salinivirgaceae bacterium]|nr:KamA family protein [Salinivirgaceae bacterium]MDD4746940.1 KamA family protein [Salinivirgaceae bacterium]MDY0280217.1 KamA family protein [Salinivirgaceae bacterium]
MIKKFLDRVAILPKAHKYLSQLLQESPRLEIILINSETVEEVIEQLRTWAMEIISKNPHAQNIVLKGEIQKLDSISWQEMGAVRLYDYCTYANQQFIDPNLKYNNQTINNPIELLWLAVKFGKGGAQYYFILDWLYLMRQINGALKRESISLEQVQTWMNNHPAGTDKTVIARRMKNKKRIIGIIIKRIENDPEKYSKYCFPKGTPYETKYKMVSEWWNSSAFHLKFAIKNPNDLNKYLDYSLTVRTQEELKRAWEAGIPFFINPYYLTLLDVGQNEHVAADHAIRDYILYSPQLIDEFGKIEAWEKEDLVEQGKPNAAGWLLPSDHSVHRRYPEVAILIPDTAGRACGGLCVSCQRMYDFQRGNLNFKIEKLLPNEQWPEKLRRLLKYWEDDSQLRDILLTGGDALMSSDVSLKFIFDEIIAMAKRKRSANEKRAQGEKYAEIKRIRLGTRLPVYLPQRITPELAQILKDFRIKAMEAGIEQFLIQTHFVTSMEITPEAVKGVNRIIGAGWVITNQQVFTTAGSRRGHTAKLRKQLAEIGILPYYTFTVKGFMENSNNFATNSRAVQEQFEEKGYGLIPDSEIESIRNLIKKPEDIVENIQLLKHKLNIPFLATDRNVMNLPGVGKSLTFRVVGLTRYGKRILKFEHDPTRRHSPIIEEMPAVYIVESKPIAKYLEQLGDMGEDITDYETIYGYSMGETQHRIPIYEYPKYDFEVTDTITNIDIN